LAVIQFGNAVGLTDDEIRGLQAALQKEWVAKRDAVMASESEQ
jgi:hypothetical protein